MLFTKPSFDPGAPVADAPGYLVDDPAVNLRRPQHMSIRKRAPAALTTACGSGGVQPRGAWFGRGNTGLGLSRKMSINGPLRFAQREQSAVRHGDRL